MKKLIALILVVILLAACATPTPDPTVTPVPPTDTPAPTPTPTPIPPNSEIPLNSIDELQGVWGAANMRYFLIVGNHFSLYQKPGIPIGIEVELSLSDGKLTFPAVMFDGVNYPPANYKIYVTRKDGNIVSFRSELDGDDPFGGRKADLKDKIHYRVNPQPDVITGSEEVPADAQLSIVGLWYNGQTGYFEFTKDNLYVIYRGFTDKWGYGKYSLADGTLKFENALMKDCGTDPVATYQVTVLKRTGQVVGLKLKLIGPDSCAFRQEQLKEVILTRASFE